MIWAEQGNVENNRYLIGMLSAITLSSNCCRLVAPMMVDVTNGREYTHASAKAPKGMEMASATAWYRRTASMAGGEM